MMLLVTKWRRGDVVRLKSGGPKMTVASGVPDIFDRVLAYSVTCHWFDGAELHEDIFDSESLARVAKRGR